MDPMKRYREQQEAINRAMDPMKRYREQQEAINRAMDPMKRYREQQESINRAMDPMKRFREQQEAINRAMDPMKRFREQQEAIARALAPLRSLGLHQNSAWLTQSGVLSYTNNPLASWREQQAALRSMMDSLVRWRIGFQNALGLSVAPSPAPTDLSIDRAAALGNALDGESVRALGEYQKGLIEQTAGPVLDAIADEVDDEALFLAAYNWATSQPWTVVQYYLEVWLKALEVLTAAGMSTAAIAGDAPSTVLLLVVAFIVCTAEFLLLLTRPGGPNSGDAS